MKTAIFFSLVVISVFFAASCNKSASNASLVTKRIQYDVNLQNQDAEMDWWVQNIDGASREKFIKQIFEQASSGKVKAYDFYSYKVLSVTDIKGIIKQVDTISVERAEPPYDLVDTLIVKEIRLSDIKRMRFLEEWKMDDNSLAFSKTVLGICPMIEKLDESGELRGYKPLFWIFIDKRFPDELLLSK